MRCRSPLGCRRQRVPARQAETESFRESPQAAKELFSAGELNKWKLSVSKAEESVTATAAAFGDSPSWQGAPLTLAGCIPVLPPPQEKGE